MRVVFISTILQQQFSMNYFHMSFIFIIILFLKYFDHNNCLDESNKTDLT